MCVYINSTTYKDKVYLLLYVNDMLLVGSSKNDLVRVKYLLCNEFDMKDLEESRKIDIIRDRD